MTEAIHERAPVLPGLFPVEESPPAAVKLAPPRTTQRQRPRRLQLTERDVWLLRWIGEQYTVRTDLLAVLMARQSTDPEVLARGRVSGRMAERRIKAWRDAGLVQSTIILNKTPATVWLTGDGYRAAGLPWRTYEPTQATTKHRHAVGLVRADAEAIDGVRWVCERDLREGLAGRPMHLPDGVVEFVDDTGKVWRTAVEVEISRKTEARVAGILRQLLTVYDNVVYHAVPDAGAVVERATAGVDGGAGRVEVRPYPPEDLATIA